VTVTAGRLADNWSALRQDVRKVPAFFRRDLFVLWSYRTAFFSDWANLILQVVLFFFINRLVPAGRLPRFGGNSTSYIEFVVVAIALTSFMQVSISSLTSALRNEQLLGTLESLLVTPTAPTTLQLGSVVYDLMYIPLRTAVFLIVMSVGFGVHFEVSGLMPAAAVLIAFIPFIWGLGVLSAAAVLVFRRGEAFVGLVAGALTLASGAYFPVEYLPTSLQWINGFNPIALTLQAMREALLGGAGWSVVLPVIAKVLPIALATLFLGVSAFQVALKYERRRGTLGLY
jgi:ABC-2 type transport system permease protein